MPGLCGYTRELDQGWLYLKALYSSGSLNKQNIRIRIAKRQPRQYRDFLDGLTILIEHGMIMSPQDFTAYQNSEEHHLQKAICFGHGLTR